MHVALSYVTSDMIGSRVQYLPVYPCPLAGAHLIAPKDRPRTSWRCATHPARMTGRVAIVAAAASWAKYRPSDEMNPTRNTGTVAAWVAVRFTAKKNSFQEKMQQISAVAARPGATTGKIPSVTVRRSGAPSISAASSSSPGTSRKNDRIIHTAIGRFIAV